MENGDAGRKLYGSGWKLLHVLQRKRPPLISIRAHLVAGGEGILKRRAHVGAFVITSPARGTNAPSRDVRSPVKVPLAVRVVSVRAAPSLSRSTRGHLPLLRILLTPPTLRVCANKRTI